MKLRVGMLIALILLLVLISSCSPSSAEALPAPEIQEVTEGDIDSGLPGNGLAQSVIVVRNETNPVTWDVFLQNAISSNMNYLTTVTDFYENHYHNAETHNGNVYLIRRIGDPDVNEAWSDDLWRYGPEGSEELIFTMPGLDFRVSPDERYIAVSASGMLWFLDQDGTILAEFQEELGILDTGRALDGLVGWADDGDEFWLDTGGPDLLFYGRVFAEEWRLETFDVREVGMRRPDCVVNPNTAMVVFSDYPMFFAVFEQEEFEAEEKAVTLSVYHFLSGEKQDIAVSVAKEFDPVWLDDQTIEYNDPLSEGRISYSLQ